MTKRNFPYIRLTSPSCRGHYYGAYENNNEDTKQGYAIFISHTEGIDDYCECMAYVHGKPCYHLIRAREIEVVFSV